MDRLPNKISGKTFKGMVSPKGYLPKATNQALKRLGKSSLLYRGETRGVSKQEALKTIKLLRQGGIKVSKSRYDQPLKIYRRAAQKAAQTRAVPAKEKKALAFARQRQERIRERKLAEAAALAEEKKKLAEEETKKRRFRAYQSIEQTEGLIEEEQGKNPMDYDPRSVLGQQPFEKTDEVGRRLERRPASGKVEKPKPKSAKPQRPNLFDIDKLPDMDIG